jgi:ElaB/YqjD/DUF883 family membrane-anchored ribosome-binding protein
MSSTEIESLERDVEEARARLSADLARLSSPRVYSEFKAGVSRDLDQLKQQAIDTTKEVARERATDMLEMVTDRIAANPAAAAAIGAGLAWRLFRHPPISTALVGLGLYGLLRSNGNKAGSEQRPRRNGTGGRSGPGIDWNAKAEVFADNARAQFSDAMDVVRDQVADTAGVVREKVSSAIDAAREQASDSLDAARGKTADAVTAGRQRMQRAASATRRKAGDMAGAAGVKAGEIASDAGGITRKTFASAADKVSEVSEAARRRASHLVEETSPRDAVLLGAAAVAIVTAIGIAAQRHRD